MAVCADYKIKFQDLFLLGPWKTDWSWCIECATAVFWDVKIFGFDLKIVVAVAIVEPKVNYPTKAQIALRQTTIVGSLNS